MRRSDNEADRGTQLGTPSRLLERVFAVVLGTFALAARSGGTVYRAVARAAEWAARAIHAVFRRIAHVAVFAAVGRAVASTVDWLGWAIDAAVNAVARFVGRCGERLAAIVRASRRVVLAVLAPVVRLLGVVVKLAATALGLLIVTLARAAEWLAAMAWKVVQGVSRVVALLVTPLEWLIVTLARAAEWLGRVAWRLLQRVGRVLALLLTPLGWLIVARARAAEWLGRLAGRLLRSVGWALASLVTPLLRWIAGLLRAAARFGSRVVLQCARALQSVLAPIGAGLLALGRGARPHLRLAVLALLVVYMSDLVFTGIGAAAPSWPLGARVAAFAGFALVVAAVGSARHHGGVGRAFVAGLRRAGLRIAYNVGVAGLKARQHVHPTPTEASGPELFGRPIAEPEMPFDIVVHQNVHVAPYADEVHAIITVTAHGNGCEPQDAASAEAAEVILLDCSGSMGQPWRKLREARRAAAAAVDTMRDGTFFAIARCAQDADVVYPRGASLARASSETRAAAKEALRLLWPEGGTAMSQWLLLARDLFATRPDALSHVILLTDGRNESDTPSAMAAALQACAGHFQCDCRGVGTEWDVAELREIATRLDGTLDIVADPADLAADFRAMTEAAMRKRVRAATLRVWTPQGGEIRYLKQTSPEIRDLTARRTPIDPLTGDYITGAWGEERRDYHLCVCLPAGPVGLEMLASRVRLVVGNRVVSKALVKAIRTSDDELSTLIDPAVAHFTGQAEMAANLRAGLDALLAGDPALATRRLGRAAQLAAENGNDGTLALLERIVTIEDAARGEVRLRDNVTHADEMLLDTRSERTVSARV